jgi:hypothetical protein
MINIIIEAIKNYNFKFVNEPFKMTVLKYLKQLLPSLNSNDIIILHTLTLVLIEEISIRYNFKEQGYSQWTQNNGRDIVSLALTLIPYIGGSNDNNYDTIENLKDIIYKTDDDKTIPLSVLNMERTSALHKYFPYSNFTLGLLNNNDNNIFDLYENNQHTIYHCIENNFISMLETIKITNGKLYINWINTIPLHNYKSSHIYKISNKEIDKIIDLYQYPIVEGNQYYNDFFKILRDNKGIYLGDYYNVFTNAYFYSIKKVKWLIFCRKVDTKYFYMIQYLNKILDLSTIFKYNDYNDLPDVDKFKFENEYKNIFHNIKNNTASYLSLKFEENIFKNLISFMFYNFSKAYLLDEYIMSVFNQIETIDSDFDVDPVYIQINNISNEILVECMSKISTEYLWNYLKEAMVILQTTPYAKYLIKKDSSNINMDFFNLVETDDAQINLKNIYNITKILSHENIEDNYVFLGNNFKSLNEFYIFRFFLIFLKSDMISALSLKKNIKLQEVRNYNYNDIMEKIQNGWDIIKLDLVWDYLNDNGLLSNFNINLELTDNNLIQISDVNIKNKKIQNGLKLFFEKNKHLFDCNYFLTNEPYNKLKITEGNKNYSRVLAEDLINYTFYANDWISQLNFFNHYINHSVMYVTGSTGTGKSTQVPKLVMYALKMYDYKNDGKVICTQPRIPPTQDNAKRIAKEMGVDIVEENKIDKVEYKTNYYYIQYKHMKDNHIKKFSNHLTLKMVTDGTLLEELVKTPMLKKVAKFAYDEKKNEQKIIMDIDNLYDVVMVDEAHEHNTNMDLILTLMRQACIYNNSLRLIIVSATMDDDEPIYRSYYKLINDNIVYPIKQPLIMHPILNKKNYFVNSYYLDRRLHISIPKASYSYKITEYYDETIEKMFSPIDMKYNANIAQKKSYELIKNICETSIYGDILLFSIGKEEIKEAVNQLNRIIPASTIALPFYSEMNSKYRDIISNIDNKISTIRNKKQNIAEEWAETFYDIKDLPEGTYKRAIIIATNVAEASITIQSLKYVVDIGYSKVNRYDVDVDSSNINVEPISESSRIQRKGRIGRVSEGTVYYLYGKGKRLNVAPKYGITLGDFHSHFIKLSSQNQDSSKGLFWSSQLSPYLYEQFYNGIKKLIKNPEIMKAYVFISNIYQIILEQFLLLFNPVESFYFYKFNELQDIHLPDYLNRLEDGYNTDNLIDIYGNFYIIHPNENILKRNIMGNIINYNNKITNKINKNIFLSMLDNIKIKLLYLPIKIKNINNMEDIFYKKTKYYEKINEVMNITKLEEKDATILYISAGFDLLFEGCQVICLLKTINDISNIIKYDGKYYYDEIRTIFGTDSDISSLYKITSLLKNKLPDLLVYSIFNNKTVLEKYKNQYNNILKEFRRKNYTAIKDSLDLMNWLNNNGELNLDRGFLYWIKSSGIFKKTLLNDINKYSTQIKLICDEYYLNYDKVLEYYEKLINLVISILSADIEYDADYKRINPFVDIKSIKSYLLKIVNTTIEDKLNYAFFISQPLFFSAMFQNGYKTLVPMDCYIKPFIKGTLNTLCINISSYIGYYSIKNNMMSIIYNINISKLASYNPYFFNTKNIVNTLINKDNNNNIIITEFNSNEWNRLVITINNSFSNLSYDIFPLNNPYFPIIQEFSKQIKYLDRDIINEINKN